MTSTVLRPCREEGRRGVKVAHDPCGESIRHDERVEIVLQLFVLVRDRAPLMLFVKEGKHHSDTSHLVSQAVCWVTFPRRGRRLSNCTCVTISRVPRGMQIQNRISYTAAGSLATTAGVEPSTSVQGLRRAFGASHEKINNLNLTVSQKGELTSLGCSLDCAARCERENIPSNKSTTSRRLLGARPK